MLPLFRFKTVMRVSFDDLDAYKVVHNSRYFCYFERGRIEYLRNLGCITAGEEGLKKIDVAVVENYCSYRNPAFFDDLLEIKLRISFIKNTSFQFQYIFERQIDSTLIACGYTNMVRVSFPQVKPIKLTKEFIEAVNKFEGNNLGKMTGIPEVK